ncbi:tetratricopeptide repeat protein [Pseudoalteromonas sp. XMcav1-K]|uniref:tetratricopeptide repeat protein n=1 Tax=Pseudoalteromonas sp. XMcav1-K TaxID=3374372 RepID=UPI003757DEAA
MFKIDTNKALKQIFSFIIAYFRPSLAKFIIWPLLVTGLGLLNPPLWIEIVNWILVNQSSFPQYQIPLAEPNGVWGWSLILLSVFVYLVETVAQVVKSKNEGDIALSNKLEDIQEKTADEFVHKLDKEYDLPRVKPSHKVAPLCEHHVHDPITYSVLEKHFESGKNIGILSGASGSGKTQALIDYVNRSTQKFDNQLWINGDDWIDGYALCDIHRTRGGKPINVVKTFNSSKTILVIDSIERILNDNDFRDLQVGFSLGGVVVLSSQLSDPNNNLYISKPNIPKKQAIEILGENPCNISEACDEFLKACSFSPLVLALARKVISKESNSNDKFYRDVLDVPSDIIDHKGESIISNILKKVPPATLKALQKIANSNLNFYDSDFLEFFVNKLELHNLQGLSIIVQSNTPGILRLHDLVAIAVRENVDQSCMVNSISEYVGKASGEMTPSILRQVHLAKKQIRDEVENNHNGKVDWLTYSLLQIEDSYKKTIHDELYNKEFTGELSLAEVMCIIDSKESYSYLIAQDSRIDYYESCAKEYQSALNIYQCDEIKAELMHHRGKALRRCGKHEQSLECFEELLKLKPNWHAIHGQIAHLGSQYKVSSRVKDAGELSIKLLVKDILSDSSVVPLRVSLAAIARIRSYYSVKNEISNSPEKVQKLASLITMSSMEGLDQFYEAFVSFTSIFSYNHSEICLDLAESIPDMLELPPEFVSKRQWVSACEALANISDAAIRQGRSIISKRLSDASLMFADKLSARAELKPFDARAVAKSYIITKKYDEALGVLSKVSQKEQESHWTLYRKSQALLGLSQSSTLPDGEEHMAMALSCAESALEKALEDTRAKDRISIYYELRSQCLLAKKEYELAKADLAKAIELCKNDKYLEDLKHRLQSIELEGA